jgi:hypothetical protein
MNVLEGYDRQKLAYLRDGFVNGFKLGCVGLPNTVISKNHRSTLQYPGVIEDFISKG